MNIKDILYPSFNQEYKDRFRTLCAGTVMTATFNSIALIMLGWDKAPAAPKVGFCCKCICLVCTALHDFDAV